MLDFEDDDIEIEEDSGDGWLISYADMMTLIACFFILMMAFANYDPVGFNLKAEKLSKAFRKDKYKSSDTKLTQITEEIASHPELKTLTKISLNDGKLVVTFSSTALFETGAWQLKEKVMKSVDALIDMIKTKDKNYRIIIEGHSDSTTLGRKGSFVSSWVLSGSRASSIAERFEYFGFDPEKIISIGRGSSKPLAPDRDEKGRILSKNLYKNNRVEIKVLEPIEKTKTSVKFGLGLYMDDAKN